MFYKYWSKSLNIHFGYWRWGDNPFRLETMLFRMQDIVANRLMEGHPSRVLDLGCGFGSTILHFLQRFPATEFTGINLDAVQVKIAKEKVEKLESPHSPKFVQGDFQSMPFPDNGFDAAYALEAACFAEGENKQKLLKEVGRVMRPGGMLVVVDGFRRQGNPLFGPIGWLYEKSLAAWGMSGLSPIGLFAKTLEGEGFDQVVVQDISWRMAPSLLHIPNTLMKLLFSNLVKNDERHWRYFRALLLTLLLSPFKRHFCYCLVTCTKSSVQLEN